MKVLTTITNENKAKACVEYLKGNVKGGAITFMYRPSIKPNPLLGEKQFEIGFRPNQGSTFTEAITSKMFTFLSGWHACEDSMRLASRS